MTSRLKTIALWILVLAPAYPVFAGTDRDPAFPPGQLIETQMDLGLFGILGGGMSYSIGGKPLSRYEDFKDLIYPLHDEEASQLIREAHEAHFAAWMMYVAGTATGLDVALAFKPAPLLNIDWFDRIATGVVAGQVFWALGALFDTNAEGRKYNAVQRYNHLLPKKDEAFLDLTPQVCLAPQGFGLGLVQTF